MKKLNRLLWVFVVGAILGACQDDPIDVMPDPVDESFYASKLGGETRVADPNNPGAMIEQGYLNLRTVVTNTVLEIATNDEGAYDALQPYFSVLLNEVGRGETSGFTTLVGDFTDFLAEATGAKNFEYEGLNMADAHNPDVNSRMTGRISSDDYDLFIGAVVEGALENEVPMSIIEEFGAILTSDGLKNAIVQG